MAAPSISMLPRSPRRRLRHRPITSTGAELRLAALAAAIMRLHEEGRCPAGWRVEPFGREVSAVLGQLVPIRSAAMLASSYAREGRRLATHAPRSSGAVDVAHPDGGDAIDVAYALRWLELGGTRAAG
jgi:hypothetical protein